MIYIPPGGSNFYLSENFKTWEFRCPCCRVLKIRDDLLDMLELVRRLAGGPIYINSGYRCPVHNKAVGGSRNSYHKRGMAVDIRSKVVTPKELAAIADTIPAVGGIGIYHNRVHVDVRDGFARWISDAVK